ncbi:hypothetical protein [Nonomuraea zeae]|uniref:Secreted protein n=1 Tax=Nonomuraea zeae TaxID=1642303 RepID=A0A5S4GDB6_9ACTN|nr:hypothetical protein [Nonomuraea zeae]TMR30504.1 hypothetical protein ETD85_28850 [Nonomuraea zeae]
MPRALTVIGISFGMTGLAFVNGQAHAASAVFADPGFDQQGPEAKQKVLTPLQAEVSARRVEGCWVRSEDPDRARGRTQIAGEGSDKCLTKEPKLYVNARLVRQRWWGLQRLADDPTTVTGRSAVYSSAVWNCAGSGTYNYHTESEHKIWWQNGTTGSDVTSSHVQRITC